MNKVNLDRLHMVLFQTNQKIFKMKFSYKHRPENFASVYYGYLVGKYGAEIVKDFE